MKARFSIDITLSDILDVPWLYAESNVLFKDPASELDDAFCFCLTANSDELRERRDGLAMKMLQYILFGMNWPNYASNPKLLEGLVLTGYSYNSWSEPTALRL